MVNHHPKEGHPPSKIWSPTNLRKAARHHQEGHPLSQGYDCTPSPWWSPSNSLKLTTIHRIVITFPSTVTHHLQDGQLDLGFDSSAAKLVNLVASPVQLVSPSVSCNIYVCDIKSLAIDAVWLAKTCFKIFLRNLIFKEHFINCGTGCCNQTANYSTYIKLK